MKNLKPDIILIGGGGHCVSVIDVIENENKFKIKGILDLNTKNKSVLNYPVLGNDDLIPSLIDDNTYFLITVGQIKTSLVRKKISEKLEKNDAKEAIVISPLAYISKYANIEKGSIIMNGAIINANAKIGKNCIINTNANIEHDVIVGDFCHISTSTVVNGNSVVKNGSFIGSNSTISNGIIIEENSIIGAGKFIK
tara:strand:- start:1840 stop:2427 length:588 start_codon:yes stop_codon:yes gene_type:complete